MKDSIIFLYCTVILNALAIGHGYIDSQGSHDLSLKGTIGWRFKVVDCSNANLSLSISKDGILTYDLLKEKDAKMGYLQVLSDDYLPLEVHATNPNLRVEVTFHLRLNLKGESQKLTTRQVHLTIHSTQPNCQFTDIPAVYKPLAAFLPPSLLESLLTKDDLIINFLKKHSHFAPHGVVNVPLDGDTRISMSVNCSQSHDRQKRQIFSNLHSPVFSEPVYSVEISEEVSLHHLVVQVTATDADEGSAGTVQYSLHADVDQRSLNIFRINSTTGWVSSRSRVNREEMAVHRFTVKAQDLGSPSNSAQASLIINVTDINDHRPAFELESYSINVSETALVDTVVVRVHADDSDTGTNKAVRYSFVGTRLDEDFEINSLSGDIKVVKKLNRENKASYVYVVKAEDQAVVASDRLSSTVTLNIRIADYNDNAPKFGQEDYSFRVREDVNVSGGPAVIGSVSATDADEGGNGVIRYVQCLA